MPSGAQVFKLLVVTTTVATADDAKQLAHALVQARLAACVQIEPVQSIYRYNDALHDEPEQRLVIKTLPRAWAALQSFMQQHHPYEVPQLVATEFIAASAYFTWASGQIDTQFSSGTDE